MRFTTFVPMLESCLNDGGNLFDLGPVHELQTRLHGILETARAQNQHDRVERIQALSSRLATIESEAVLRYGAQIADPSMELVVCMRLPPDAAELDQGPLLPAPAPSSDLPVACPICMDDFPSSETLGLFSCSHRYCADCFRQHFSHKIRAGEVSDAQLRCPEPSCAVSASSYELEAFLPADVFEKYLDFLALQDVRGDQDTCWCPNARCGEAITALRSTDEVACPLCKCTFCKKCQISPWHGGKSCDEAREALKEAAQLEEQGLVIWMQAQGAKVKPCIGCKEGVEKNDGCNHMTCSRCSAQWCWLCQAAYVYGHFNEGPCAGLQFAKGDTLQEARDILNPPVPETPPPEPDVVVLRTPEQEVDVLPPPEPGVDVFEDIDDPEDVEDVIEDIAPPSTSAPSTSTSAPSTSRPSRIQLAGALALTIGTAGLAAPLYVRLRKKRDQSTPTSIPISTPTPVNPLPQVRRPIRCRMRRPDPVPVAQPSNPEILRPQIACGMRRPEPVPVAPPVTIACGMRRPNPRPVDILPVTNIACGMRRPVSPPNIVPTPPVSIPAVHELLPLRPISPPEDIWGVTIMCGMRRPPSPEDFLIAPDPSVSPPLPLPPPPPPSDLLDISLLTPPQPPPPPIACGMRCPSPPRFLHPPPQVAPIACGMRCPSPPNILPAPVLELPEPEPLLKDLKVVRRCGKRPQPQKKKVEEVPKQKPSKMDKQVDCGKRRPDIKRCSRRPPIRKPLVPAPMAWPEEVRQRIFDTAKTMLAMLETIEDHYAPGFHNPERLMSAWARFVRWIDMLERTPRDLAQRLVPPLDVAFVWHAYMIRTEIYLEDLPQILGRDAGDMGMQIRWKYGAGASEEDQVISRSTWEGETGLPFDLPADWNETTAYAGPVSSSSPSPPLELPFQLRMSFMLEDLKWLPDLRRGWPDFTQPELRCGFLSDSLESYLQWLETAYRDTSKSNGKGPPIDLDAFWHAHMLHPADYKQDTELHYGVGSTIWHRPLADGVHPHITH